MMYVVIVRAWNISDILNEESGKDGYWWQWQRFAVYRFRVKNVASLNNTVYENIVVFTILNKMLG